MMENMMVESITVRSNNCVWCKKPWVYIIEIGQGEFQVCEDHYREAIKKNEVKIRRKR